MSKLTVITATYNRAECLEGCWKSLKNQTCKDFQWLVIDDGSTDSTKAVVKNFQEQTSEFQIDYVYKENGGKHTALNESHTYIQGEYVVTLDSDDELTEDAVEKILNAWEQYKENEEVGQIIFLKGFSTKEPICYVKNENVVVDTLTEQRVGIHGRDCCDTFRTSLFVRYPFPVFEGERFIGEGAAFLFIQFESKGVYVNDVIYICSYRDDGLTKAGRKMRLLNPLGGRFNSRIYMDKRLPIKTRIKKGILYVCYSKFAKIGFIKTIKECKYKLLVVATYIPGSLLYCYWKKKYFSE